VRELREKRGYVLWEKENRKSIAFFTYQRKLKFWEKREREPRTRGYC